MDNSLMTEKGWELEEDKLRDQRTERDMKEMEGRGW